MNRFVLHITALVTFAVLMSGISAAVTVTVSPPTSTVYIGSQLQFTATVTGTPNTFVTWSVSGPGCFGVTCGSITTFGVYTAPATIPSPPTVTVTATSLADGTTGSAVVTLQSVNSVSVAISPTFATVAVGQHQQFTATVTGAQNTAVAWSLSGIGCVGASCGTLSGSGLYTAPATVPVSPTLTVTATSVADPSKFASASVVVTQASSVAVTISPTSAHVPPNGQQQFTATVTGTSNTGVLWSVYGSGCSGPTCGFISNSGLYMAPPVAPNPATVTVQATSVADQTKYATATVTVASGATITITPPSAQVAVNQQQQFTATVTGSGNQTVVWSLAGTGCVGLGCGTISSSGVYTAPSIPPTPPTVSVTATLLTDVTVSASAAVTVTSGNSVGVTVSPSQATVGTGAQQQFTATVTGTQNTAVTWSVSGFGCVGTTCGTVDSTGLYTAPITPPNPPFFNLVAQSVANPAKTASAFVTVRAQVSVTIAPSSAMVPPGTQKQFTATATGSQNTTVIWSVSGPGCSGAACGTVTASGLYTAPPVAPTPPTAYVTATSQADTTKYATATATIAAPITVVVSPPIATVTSGATQQFTATVTGSTNTAVTWSVQGAGCNGVACGSIDQTGLYTAPITVPNPPTVTVAATAQADGVSSGTAAITLTPTANSRLHGQYAFLLKGYDQSGYPYQMVGSFTADGNGNITTGIEDIDQVPFPNLGMAIFPGTYNVGGDSRGTLQITTSLGSFSYAFALNGTGKSGTITTIDNSGIRVSGIFKLQDPNAFNMGGIAGGFAISLSGQDLFSGRIGALAALYPNGAGYVAGNSMDVNDAGNQLGTFIGFPGTYTVDSTGRGTMFLGLGSAGFHDMNFALYVVNSTEFFVVTSDPVLTNGFIIFGGDAVTQAGGPYSMGSFNATSVFNVTALRAGAPDIRVGVFNFDGNGNAVMVYDENNGGQTQVGTIWPATYDMQINGHGTLHLFDPNNAFDRPIWWMYATGPNSALVMDSTDPAVPIGSLEFQQVSPPFDNSNIVGTYTLGSIEAVSPNVPVFAGAPNFDGSSANQGSGNVSGAVDEMTPTGPITTQPVFGVYSLFRNNYGRGGMTLANPSGHYGIWLISPNEFIAMPTDSTATQPTVWHFKQ